MKLLLDENLSRRIVPFLQEAFPGSSQVALLGLEQADDRAIWEFAKREGFVLVTKDADFYDLSVVLGAPPRVVWLRTGNTRKATVAKLLLDRRLEIEQLLSGEGNACVEIF